MVPFLSKKSSTLVQSDIANLQNLVSSVQGSIAARVDTALANGLADINASINALEAQVGNIASAEDEDAINSSSDGIEADLDDLLASNNIFW